MDPGSLVFNTFPPHSDHSASRGLGYSFVGGEPFSAVAEAFEPTTNDLAGLEGPGLFHDRLRQNAVSIPIEVNGFDRAPDCRSFIEKLNINLHVQAP